MKSKLIITYIFLLNVLVASAQNDISTSPPLGPSSFGIFGGINFQNINGKDADGNKLSNSLVTRFHLGLNYDIPIANEFYTQIGLQFISKGTKGEIIYKDNSGSRILNREIKMNYLEVPISLIYKPLLGNGHMILGFGPYVGYCIGGKAIFTGASAPSDMDLQFRKTVPVGEENNLIYFKKLDVGANAFFGYEFQSGLYLLLNSQLGLININSDTNSKMVNKNTGFGLSLGFRFL